MTDMANDIQAAGVIASLVIAGGRYVQVQRNAVRTSIQRMLNLVDEFHLLMNDELRFKLFENGTEDFDQSFFTDEVDSFSSKFRECLDSLWSSVESARLFFSGSRKTYGRVLNSANLSLKALERMKIELQFNKMKQIQKQKEYTAKVLLAFAVELTKYAEKQLFYLRHQDLETLFESLKCYVENKNKVLAIFQEYCDRNQLESVVDITNKEKECVKSFFLADTYWYKGLDKKFGSSHYYVAEEFAKQIQFSSVFSAEQRVFSENLTQQDNLKINNELQNALRAVVKRVALLGGYQNEKHETLKIARDEEHNWFVLEYHGEITLKV